MAAKRSPWERVRELTSWHSLSGYLEYKTGGPLGKLKGSKRAWFILEDSSSLLLCYRTKEEATKQREPRGQIPLQGAGITLDPKELNQFIVICGEKEHFFRAENHESMMIWLIGLQAKRDFFATKRLGVSTSADSHAETIQEEYEVIPTPPCEDQTSDPPLALAAVSRETKPPDNIDSNHGNNDSQVIRPKFILRESMRSLTTSTLDLFRKQKNQNQWRQQRLKKILGESMDGGLDLYKDQEFIFDDLKTDPESNEFVALSQLPFIKRLSMYSSVGNLASDDNVFVADRVLSADEASSARTPAEELDTSENGSIQKASSEGMDVNKGMLGNMCRESQRRSGSGRSGSSDSLLDRNSENELLSQLNELEQQLISTKCEMAMLLNRETCYQEVLERRDSIIIELDQKLEEISRCKEASQKNLDKKLKEEVRQLQNQNRFLNEEVRRLTQLRQKEFNNLQIYNVRVQELLAKIEQWKRDYVFLLQSCISIPTGDIIDGMEVALYGGDKHKERVKELLEECRRTNPCLPMFERLARTEVHVDHYGFKHSYPTEGLLLHYLCQQLHSHYQLRLESYDQHQQQWKTLLRKGGPRLTKTKELKLLCRHGIPDHHRAEIWRKLVYAQVGDIMDEKGPHYYNHLVNMAYDSQYAGNYRKQIMLDLLRTMPANVNFNSKESEGIMRMKEVLQAFCMHNPDIGYCQGLNFVVGMCLLFLDTEDAFWTLVAITEKYFSPNYFDKTLTGAQADQEVLKEMLKFKLPTVYDHLENIDIELSTVTFNWFLAIFFEAVPFQTLIRIWDCFLAEGPKVLFRFSIAIIKMNQPGILMKKDTINVMRHLKVCGKLMFDVDGLMRVSFNELKPFPRRRDIAAKQVVFLNALKEKLKKREAYRRKLEEKNKMLDELDMIPPSALVYECAAHCGQDLAWICLGEQNYGKVMSVQSAEALARDTNIEVESHILSVFCVEEEIFLIGTLSRILHAYSIKTNRELWCLTLNDSIFSLCVVISNCSNRLFSGMGDGTVAIIDQIHPKEPQDEPFYIPVGRSPVGSIVYSGTTVWIACGNAIHVMQAQSLDMMDKIAISSNPFDHVLTLAKSTHGIWTTIKGSSVIELWDAEQFTCKMLYDVQYNKIIPRKNDEDGSLNRFRITTLLPINSMLWVGTGDGILTMYTIHDRSHLKQTSHTLKDASASGDKRRRHRNCKEVSKSRESKAEKRMSREQSRSQEMLLNGLVDEEEVGWSSEERRLKNKVREKRERAAQIRQARTSRRTRVQELKMEVLSSSQPDMDAEQHVKCLDGDQDVKSQKIVSSTSSSLPVDAIDANSTSNQSDDILPHTTEEDLLKQGKLVRLQRQRQVSTKTTSSENDSSKAMARAGGVNGGSDNTGCSGEKSNECSGEKSNECSGEKSNECSGEKSNECSGEKSNECSEEKPNDPVVKSIPKELLRDDSLHDEVFQSMDDDLDEGQTQQEVGKSQNTEEGNDKDVNMNLPPKSLRDILKTTLGKTQAPPQESTVTAQYSRTLTINVRGPSSASTYSDRESPEDQVRPGLAHEGVFNIDDINVAQTTNKNNVSEKPFVRENVRNPDYVIRKLKKFKSSTTSTDSTSGTSTSKGSVISVFTGSVLSNTPETVPEGEASPVEDSNMGKNKSVSMEMLQVSDKPTRADLHSDSQLQQVSGTESLLSCSAPNLSGRSLSPMSTNQRGERRSDENLILPRTASSSTISSSSFSDLTYLIDLAIQTKVKVSNRPVKCLVPTSCNGNMVVLSCAGCYGDDEAVLKWSKKAGESVWTNEPVPEVCPVTNLPRRPSYMRHMSVERSLST